MLLLLAGGSFRMPKNDRLHAHRTFGHTTNWLPKNALICKVRQPHSRVCGNTCAHLLLCKNIRCAQNQQRAHTDLMHSTSVQTEIHTAFSEKSLLQIYNESLLAQLICLCVVYLDWLYSPPNSNCICLIRWLIGFVWQALNIRAPLISIYLNRAIQVPPPAFYQL